MDEEAQRIFQRHADGEITLETLNSGARMFELSLQPMAGHFDTGHLKALHFKGAGVTEPKANRNVGTKTKLATSFYR